MPETLLQLALDELMPDPTQPRKTFPDEEIARLAASLKARGMLQPLRVSWDAERKCWRIVTGECRWRAANAAGLSHVPCLPIDGQPDEVELLADQVIENTVRNALRPLELARSLAKLKALKGCNSQTLAEELGLSGAAITRAGALMSLPESIQAMVDCGQVSESTAYEISRLPDEPSKLEMAQAVAQRGMNRDQVAEAVRNRIGKKNVKPKASRLVCKLDGGFSVSFSSGGAMRWDELLAHLDRIRREAKKLCDGGKEITALPQVLRAR